MTNHKILLNFVKKSFFFLAVLIHIVFTANKRRKKERIFPQQCYIPYLHTFAPSQENDDRQK